MALNHLSSLGIIQILSSVALFISTAPASAQASLVRGCFDNCACFAYLLSAWDERTESEAESKADSMVSEKAYVVRSLLKPFSLPFPRFHSQWTCMLVCFVFERARAPRYFPLKEEIVNFYCIISEAVASMTLVIAFALWYALWNKVSTQDSIPDFG